MSGVDQANVMGIELVVGVLLWGGVGYAIDNWLGILPVFTTVGVLGGMCAGLYLMHLRGRRMEQADVARRGDDTKTVDTTTAERGAPRGG